jgi:broad specificity phosphatase PhoE
MSVENTNPEEKSNILYLVRHGENQANIMKELSCRIVDYPLNGKGRLQAKQTGSYFLTKQVDEIYCSPLIRAVETAEIIGSRLSRKVVRMDNFRELDVGELELMGSSPEAWRVYFDVLESWRNGNPERNFPGGDNYFSARDRMRIGVESILTEKHRCSVIIVGHGGLFTTSMFDLCPGIEMSTLMKTHNHNCSVSELQMQYIDNTWRGDLLRWADISHLHGFAADLVSGVPE